MQNCFLLFCLLIIVKFTQGQALPLALVVDSNQINKDNIPAQELQDILNYTGLTEENVEYLNFKEIAGASGLNSEKIKPSVSLDEYLPIIGKQGNRNTCTSFSVAASLSIQENLKKGLKFQTKGNQNAAYFYSPAVIFNLAKKVFNEKNCNEGISYSDAVYVLENYKILSLNEVPYSAGNNCDIEQANVIEQRRIFRLKIVSAESINSGNLISLLNAKPAKPICIKVNIDDNYAAALYGNNYTWATRGKVASNPAHAMLMVGYDNSKKAFKILDSRGPEKGDHGFIWIPYSFVDQNDVTLRPINSAYVISNEQPTLAHEQLAEIPGMGNSQVFMIPEDGGDKKAVEQNDLGENYYIQIDTNLKIVLIKANEDSNTCEIQLQDMQSNLLDFTIEVPIKSQQYIAVEGKSYLFKPTGIYRFGFAKRSKYITFELKTLN